MDSSISSQYKCIIVKCLFHGPKIFKLVNLSLIIFLCEINEQVNDVHPLLGDDCNAVVVNVS